jgi:hypothetical protein
LEAHRERTSEVGQPARWGKLGAALSNKERRNGNSADAANLTDDIALSLDQYVEGSSAVVLHHRRLPGIDATMGHLVVSSAGLTVIDASNYGSRRARVGRGGLRVGWRNRSDLIHRVVQQVDSVKSVLADTPFADVHIDAALAWRQVEGAPILYSFNGPRVMVCGLRKIAQEASRPGSLSEGRVKALAAFLERELPLV